MANFEGHINIPDRVVTIQGLYRENGKENGNYHCIYGIIEIYVNHGKDKGSYHIIEFTYYVTYCQKSTSARVP